MSKKWILALVLGLLISLTMLNGTAFAQDPSLTCPPPPNWQIPSQWSGMFYGYGMGFGMGYNGSYSYSYGGSGSYYQTVDPYFNFRGWGKGSSTGFYGFSYGYGYIGYW